MVIFSERVFAFNEFQVLLPEFLDDVSLWHSEVELHGDYTRYQGKYIDGLVIGNGSMLAVEGMTTGITRYNKSRLTDSRFHQLERFKNNSNGFIEHLSRSPKLPLHYMQWVSGPVYTEYPVAYGFYYTMDYSVSGHDKSIEMNGWNFEKQYRIRNTNIVKNVLQTEDVLVVSVDFMFAKQPVLARYVTLTNTSGKAIDTCRFYVTFYIDPRNYQGNKGQSLTQRSNEPGINSELEFYIKNVHCSPAVEGKVVKNAILIESGTKDFDESDTKKLMLVYSPESFANTGKQFIQFNTGNIEKGRTKTFCFYILTSFEGSEIEKNLNLINSSPSVTHLEDSYRFWKDKISEADQIAVPLKKDISPYEKDYIDNLRLFLLSCHTRFGGSIAHPYSYNFVFFRDAYDVYRAMLALGHREECKATLLFLKEAMNRFGIKMSYSAAEFYLSSSSGSSKIGETSIPGKFSKSEYMLFFPIMVRDYYYQFNDEEIAVHLYPEMKASLKSQPVDGDGLIAYSGDEISVKRGRPLYKYSPQNAALYVMGAEFLVKIAEKLELEQDAIDLKTSADKVRKATERFFWHEKGYYMYSADIDGNRDNRLNVFSQALPFFYGYLSPNDKQLNKMLENILDMNTFRSFRISTLPIEGKQVCLNNGNTSGLLLYLMSMANHPDSEKVFKRILGDSGTMGTTGEYLTVSNDWISRGEMLRPYETSFNLIAVLSYFKKN